MTHGSRSYVQYHLQVLRRSARVHNAALPSLGALIVLPTPSRAHPLKYALHIIIGYKTHTTT